MNLKAEINWIKAELIKVDDPNLIMAIKSMLKVGIKKAKSSDLDESLNRAIRDKENGKTKSHQDIRKKYEKWL